MSIYNIENYRVGYIVKDSAGYEGEIKKIEKDEIHVYFPKLDSAHNISDCIIYSKPLRKKDKVLVIRPRIPKDLFKINIPK